MNGNQIIDVSQFLEKTTYIMQDSILCGTLTPTETFNFAADIRLTNKSSKEERGRRVESIINDLGLASCAETWVGDEFLAGMNG